MRNVRVGVLLLVAFGLGSSARAIEVDYERGTEYQHSPSGLVLPPRVGEFVLGSVHRLPDPDRVSGIYELTGDPKVSVAIVLYDDPVPPGEAEEALRRAERGRRRDLRSFGRGEAPRGRMYVAVSDERRSLGPRFSTLPAHWAHYDLTEVEWRGYAYEYVMFHHGQAIVRISTYRREDSPDLLAGFLEELPW